MTAILADSPFSIIQQRCEDVVSKVWRRPARNPAASTPSATAAAAALAAATAAAAATAEGVQTRMQGCLVRGRTLPGRPHGSQTGG